MTDENPQQSTIEEKWRSIADKARSEANAMAPCEERETLLNKARQLDVAANLNAWLSSPGTPPK